MSFIEDIPEFFTKLMCKSSAPTTEEKWVQARTPQDMDRTLTLIFAKSETP